MGVVGLRTLLAALQKVSDELALGQVTALLAIGFWKRIAFIRWQALVLLLFTICKVFLYDIGSLSAGYRVVSFFGLGAVLMAVSFAYQKDWLALKDTSATSGKKDGPA